MRQLELEASVAGRAASWSCELRLSSRELRAVSWSCELRLSSRELRRLIRHARGRLLELAGTEGYCAAYRRAFHSL